MNIQALAFDTGGTVLDWHGGIVRELRALGARHGVERDWHEVANHWRRRTMQGIVGKDRPRFNMDDVHLRTLNDTLDRFELRQVIGDERFDLWRAWHRLDTWPDFTPALSRLRAARPVVSFTMLPTRLVVDVSRRNGFAWDAVISCEMIGAYKARPEAYDTAARWLDLDPSQILMVACHNFDLNAAHTAGYCTAFVHRPDEWGPGGPPDPEPNMDYDFVADGFAELADQVLDRIGVGRPRAAAPIG